MTHWTNAPSGGRGCPALFWAAALIVLFPAGGVAQVHHGHGLPPTPPSAVAPAPDGPVPVPMPTSALDPRVRKVLIGGLLGAVVGSVVGLAACTGDDTGQSGNVPDLSDFNIRAGCFAAVVTPFAIAGGVIGYVIGTPRTERAVRVEAGRHGTLRLVAVVRP